MLVSFLLRDTDMQSAYNVLATTELHGDGDHGNTAVTADTPR